MTDEATGRPDQASDEPRYDRLERIGQGGMGTVYCAWDRVLKRRVALKILLGEEPEQLERFAREALVANPDDGAALRARTSARMRWAQLQLARGKDPAEAFRLGVEELEPRPRPRARTRPRPPLRPSALPRLRVSQLSRRPG